MPTPLISPAEKDYIKQGVEYDCRADGRSRLEYRHLILESGLLSQTSGSARCRLGDSDVLVGVKVEIGEIEQDQPDRGRVVCNVECSPSASQQFEGRGADEINNTLTLSLERFLSGPQSGLDLAKLCIIPGRQCWVIHVDAMVMDCAGNLLDCIIMTTRAALFDTRIPKTEIQDLGEGEYEFEVIDDVEDAEPIGKWDMLPLAVTLYKVGDRYIIDPTILEELCSEVTLTVGVNKEGAICGVQKGAVGSIDPSLLTEMIQTATTLGKTLIEQLDAKLIADDRVVQAKRTRGEPIQKLGFFAAVF
ncbi:ribosomal protein S5 domain 2-type protein [Zychaea mexicana]|uniref:ribosomal protein S5 domain 2-type protein n=1 Tax=Zychaea mexicana TaxID=64656 RepID=UPI0022FDB80F|nr:ribosomal protein S5 domain 2-type protein [Zychaea mexicana]KAI9494413.1 ribosomal protein S5 domain 2-type protein [Zychaea mexicana]